MRQLIKPVLVGAMLMGSFAATPATANDNDVAKIILGVAGIAALAAILDKNDRKATVTQRAKPHHVQRKRHRQARHRVDYQQCLRQRWTQSGWQTFVSNRCVARLNQTAKAGHGHGHHDRFRARRWAVR